MELVGCSSETVMMMEEEGEMEASKSSRALLAPVIQL